MKVLCSKLKSEMKFLMTFPCLMTRNEIPGPLLRWLADFHPRSIATISSPFDLALLLVPRPSFLQSCLVPSSRHLRLSLELPSTSLPLGPCFPLRECPPRPVARPVKDVFVRVVAAASCGDHLAASLLTLNPHCPYAFSKVPPCSPQRDGTLCIGLL